MIGFSPGVVTDVPDKEIEIIESYLESLPPLHQKTLQERLVGIFFINKFIGSGMADYVLDEENNIYSLQNDINTWMTHRENTCFAKDNN